MKTETHCPTCGAECTVEGCTTHYYKPQSAGCVEKLRFHEWATSKGLSPDAYAIAKDAWEAAKWHYGYLHLKNEPKKGSSF